MSRPYIARGRKTRHHLTNVDKLNAIYRIQNGETKASVSRDIGVPESTLRGWCKRAARDNIQPLKSLSVAAKPSAMAGAREMAPPGFSNGRHANSNNNGTHTHPTPPNKGPNSRREVEMFRQLMNNVQQQYAQVQFASQCLEAQIIQQQYELLQRQQMQKLLKQQEQLHLEQMLRDQQRNSYAARQEMLAKLFTPRHKLSAEEAKRADDFVEDLLNPQKAVVPPQSGDATAAPFPLSDFIGKLVNASIIDDKQQDPASVEIPQIMAEYYGGLQEHGQLRSHEYRQEKMQLRVLLNVLNEYLATGSMQSFKRNMANFGCFVGEMSQFTGSPMEVDRDEGQENSEDSSSSDEGGSSDSSSGSESLDGESTANICEQSTLRSELDVQVSEDSEENPCDAGNSSDSSSSSSSGSSRASSRARSQSSSRGSSRVSSRVQSRANSRTSSTASSL